MKTKLYFIPLISALMTSTVVAQDNTTPATPATPTAPAPTAPATTAPAAPAPTTEPTAPPKTEAKPKAKKKKAATVKAPKAKDAAGPAKLVFDPPASATVKQEAINVRGQDSFIGEVITHLHKGETVTVLEEITRKNPKKDEPAKWAKILMPTNTPVWVSGEYVDSGSMTASKRLNVRGGPGENYSVVARLEKGTAIKEIRKSNGWIEIETPTNAVGYVAANFLDIKPATAPAIAENKPTETALAPTPAPEPAQVKPEEPAVAAKPEEKPAAPAPAPEVTAPAPTAAVTNDVSNEPPPKRVVTREGTVRKARNIQAPTDYELRDARTGDTIEYLISATADKTLKPYLGLRVLVTGPEAMDARWKSTPIMEVETIEQP